MEQIKIFIFATLALFITGIASATTNDSCQMNGYSRPAIYAREAQIVKALRTGNNKQLSQLMSYPLQINLTNGTHTIKTPEEFLKFQKKLIVEQDAKTVINHLTKAPHDIICRADGIGLMNGGLWLSPYNLKIMTVNKEAVPNTQLLSNKPYGQGVSGITNKAILTEFARLYNQMRHDNTIDGAALFVVKIGPNAYQLDSEANEGTINLYRADIDNSGTDSYILSYDNQGSLNVDGIQFIGKIDDNKLVPLDFKKALKHNFHIDTDQWYLFHGTPFLTRKGETYMNYVNNGMVCTYVWKNGTIKLIARDSVDCMPGIHN